MKENSENKVYYSKIGNPEKWDVPASIRPAWFWLPVLRVFNKIFRMGWTFYDLRKNSNRDDL